MRKHFQSKPKTYYSDEQQFRSKWDMVHTNKTDYQRERKRTKDYLEEFEEEFLCIECEKNPEVWKGYCEECLRKYEKQAMCEVENNKEVQNEN